MSHAPAVFGALSKVARAEILTAERPAIATAAATGQLDDVEALLADDRIAITERTYALLAAAEHGRLAVVERLLADPLVDPGAAHPKAAASRYCGDRSREDAMLSGDLPLEYGDVNDEALRVAAAGGHLEVVARLLADPRVSPASGDACPAFEVAVHRGHVGVARVLLADARCVLGDFAYRALHIAAGQGNAAMVDLLLRDGRCDPSPPLQEHRSSRCRTVWQQIEVGGNALEVDQALLPIAAAAAKGFVTVVDLLLADPRVDPTLCCNLALDRAMKGHHIAVVERLLAHPRFRDLSRNYGAVLSAAAFLGDGELVTRILADDSAVLPQNGGEAACAAAAGGHLDLLRVLLAHPRVNRAHAVSYAVAEAAGGNVPALDLLIREYGGDPTTNVLVRYSNAPIVVAAERGHVAAVRRLLDDERVGGNSIQVSEAFVAAAVSGRVDVAEALLSHPAVDPSCYSVIAAAGGVAAFDGNLPFLQALMRDPRVDLSVDCFTYLRPAAENRHFAIVDALLSDARVRRAAAAAAERLPRTMCAYQAARLLQEFPDEPALSTPERTQDLLMIGAAGGHRDLVARVLSHPKSHAVIDAELIEEAAECAAAACSPACVELLVHDGRASAADVIAAALFGAASLHRMPLVLQLLEDPRLHAGAGGEGALAATLKCAAGRGDASLLRRVLADVRLGDAQFSQKAIHSAVLAAASLGRLAALDVLLADTRFSCSEDVFYHAASLRAPWSAAVLQRLLALPADRADLTGRKELGLSALEQAATSGNVGCVELLLADERIRANIGCESTPTAELPACYAARYGRLRVLEVLLADPIIDPTRGDEHGLMPPLLEAAVHGHADIVECLLADPRVEPSIDDSGPGRAVRGDTRSEPASRSGNTALHWAAASGVVSTVERLLADPRVYVQQCNGAGLDALDAAIGCETAFPHCERTRVAGDRLAVCRRLLQESSLLHARLRRPACFPDLQRLGIDAAGLGQQAWARRRSAVAARACAFEGNDGSVVP